MKQYKITKVRRVLRLAANDFQTGTYSVWRVTGPKGFKKYFTTRKDAAAWVRDWTSRKALTADQLLKIIK